MQFKTSIHDYEIAGIFDRFVHVVGDRHWRRRVRQLSVDMKGNPFLKSLLHRDNDVAFALDKCSDLVNAHGRLPVGYLDLTPLYPAITFAAQSLAMLDMVDARGHASLLGRIKGALANPEDLRAIQLEHTAASHFAKRGHRLTWPEMSGDGTFDLLVKNIGPSDLEVECKSISANKGRKITNRDAVELWHLLSPLVKTLRDPSSGLAIVLTLPDRLPTNHVARQRLAKRVAETIHAGQSLDLDEASVTLHPFSLERLADLTPQNVPHYRPEIETITGTNNREIMVKRFPDGGIAVFIVQSQQDDTLYKALQKTVKYAATNQLSGTRPGLILVEFNELPSETMIDIAHDDNTPGEPPSFLRVWVSEFLSNTTKRDHIVGVVFLSRSKFYQLDESTASNSSSAYYFPRKESPLWDEAFLGLFNT